MRTMGSDKPIEDFTTRFRRSKLLLVIQVAVLEQQEQTTPDASKYEGRIILKVKTRWIDSICFA